MKKYLIATMLIFGIFCICRTIIPADVKIPQQEDLLKQVEELGKQSKKRKEGDEK